MRFGYTMMCEQTGPRELVRDVVAQKAATVALLSGGRFTLGLGAGENLNEHVVGGGWPGAAVRHERLREAVAVSGPQSCALAGELADLMIAVEPESSYGELFDAAGGKGKPRVGQLPLCFDTDAAAARKRAHEQFRWFGGGWKVNAELPGPASFAGATSFVREEDVAESIPCGADVDAVVEACTAFGEAGFTDLALVQIGGEHQAPYLEWAERDLLPALRSALG